LIAYFISNISAKKVLKSTHTCRSYSKPKVGRFLRHGVGGSRTSSDGQRGADCMPPATPGLQSCIDRSCNA